MLRRHEQTRMSNFEGLYDQIIPKDNELRQIAELVDFSFVIDILQDKYCHDNGRDAECPIRVFKYLMLKGMKEISDSDLVERSRYDMSYKFFLGYRPEDDVICSSLLTKFRKLRLTDEGIMDTLIGKTVELAIAQGLIKGAKLIVDSTHSLSRYHNRRPHEVLQEHAKRLRKAVYAVDDNMGEKFPKKVTGDNIEEHIEYCKQLIEVIENDERFLLC